MITYYKIASVVGDGGGRGKIAVNFPGDNDIDVAFTAFSGEWKLGRWRFLIGSCLRLQGKAFGRGGTP